MFKKAIVRRPGSNFADGITTSDLGEPDYESALYQHEQYCDTLKECGLELTVLEPDPRYPDGCFVEDTAVITEKCAVITRPSDLRRQGEEEEIEKILSEERKIEKIEAPGTLEGGDVLRIGNHFYIGRSRRTNEDGANQLISILTRYGYTASTIPVNSVLHLKTGVTYLGNNDIVSIDEFSDKFENFRVLKIGEPEEYSANCLPINDYLLIPKGFKKTKLRILALGYLTIDLEMSEFEKMDGGLTCLSLLY